jgi:hypothetical protein
MPLRHVDYREVPSLRRRKKTRTANPKLVGCGTSRLCKAHWTWRTKFGKFRIPWLPTGGALMWKVQLVSLLVFCSIPGRLDCAKPSTATALATALHQFQACILDAGSAERCRPSDQAMGGLMEALDASKLYVANKRLPGGVSEMAAEEPRLLRQSGCRVESAPRSSRDYLFPDEGEPIFVIRALCGGKRIELRNRFNSLTADDLGLRTAWSVSDLIVKVK